MHYHFEIQLIISEIVAGAFAAGHSRLARQVAREHVKRYLDSYYAKHRKLPTGRHHLGVTQPLNLKIGMVDFDTIRRKIRIEAEAGDHLRSA